MARVHTVKKSAKDYPLDEIKKGDTYYWWAFRHGGKHRSKTYPKPWQLTASEYLSQVLQIQDAIGNITASDVEDLKSQVSDLSSQLQELADDCQGKYDNMPENLQQGDTGQLLESRVSAMESAVEELEGIDLDDIPDEADLIEEVREEIMEEIDGENEFVSEDEGDIEIALTDLGKLGGLSDEDKKAAIMNELEVRKELNEKVWAEHEEEIGERVHDKMQETLQEKIEEVQNISIETE